MSRGERGGVRVSRVVVTCEHGGNRVPARYRSLFEGRERLLASHRGWDPGALELARLFSKRLGAPLVAATVSRLVVDLNRSLENPSLFSVVTGSLDDGAKQRVLGEHYRPYRERVEREVRGALQGGGVVLHLSVHSFTPVLRGVRRGTDIGLLFHPGRELESALCRGWARGLGDGPLGRRVRGSRGLAVHLNAPYRGTDDGLTTHLRGVLPAGRYLGIELEVNQRFPRRGGRAWEGLKGELVRSLAEIVEG